VSPDLVLLSNRKNGQLSEGAEESRAERILETEVCDTVVIEIDVDYGIDRDLLVSCGVNNVRFGWLTRSQNSDSGSGCRQGIPIEVLIELGGL
jgi:hypothetical protein